MCDFFYKKGGLMRIPEKAGRSTSPFCLVAVPHGARAPMVVGIGRSIWAN